jgi:predicted transcriptional regulator
MNADGIDLIGVRCFWVYDGVMKRVELLLDDQTDELLSSLAEAYNGDKSEALREILRPHTLTEAELDEIEESNTEEFARQLKRSEEDFKAGRFKTWEEVKRKAGL